MSSTLNGPCSPKLIGETHSSFRAGRWALLNGPPEGGGRLDRCAYIAMQPAKVDFLQPHCLQGPFLVNRNEFRHRIGADAFQAVTS